MFWPKRKIFRSIFPTSAKCRCTATKNLLREIFLNLLDNAVKYNHEGGSVSVSAEKAESHYRVIITDTGTGIPAEEQQKIFDRFFRTDKARTRGDKTTGGGAGLGLSIAQWAARAHDGEISLVKSSAAGSTFVVAFRLK